MKNGVFWDVTPCGSCKNRRFGGLSASFARVTRIGELGTTQAATSNRRTLRGTNILYTYKVKLSLQQTVVAYKYLSCELRISFTYRK
jgi:hypothetical protein